MFFKSIVKAFDNSYDTFNYTNFDKIDQGLVRFFRIEYGNDWKTALEHHLYKERLKKTKKAA